MAKLSPTWLGLRLGLGLGSIVMVGSGVAGLTAEMLLPAGVNFATPNR